MYGTIDLSLLTNQDIDNKLNNLAVKYNQTLYLNQAIQLLHSFKSVSTLQSI